MNTFKAFVAVAAAVTLSFGAASAATLSVVNPDSSTNIPGDFNPSNFPAPEYGGLSIGDAVDAFLGGGTFFDGGLSVDVNAFVTFTFLGKEAGETNSLVELITGGGATVFDTGDAFLTSATFQFGPGFIPFSLTTTNNGGQSLSHGVGAGDNDIIADGGLNIAFYLIPGEPGSALVFFGDNEGDSDLDDLVFRIDVQAVPIPGAAVLFATALLGGGLLRRRKLKAAATA